jgi:predicted O-linked N-acetylglucosamine transferase (SPINDLY family)
MITCTGNTFASRVGASLLNAVGLSELATESFTGYEAMALRLATNPALMAETRQRLNANRLSSPLFDIVRYTRHLEAAYLHMASHDREGLPAASFSVNQAG